MIVKIGNLFDSKAKTLVNTVNCVGVMGKGIAAEFKIRFPDMYQEYVRLCREGAVEPGKPYLYTDLFGTSIINFPTKDHWKSPSKLSYIISGLDWFVTNYERLGIKDVAFPPLGCGNGGLEWEVVGPLIYSKLKDLPINIELYAPYGTKREKITPSFLNSHRVPDKDILGGKNMKFNDRWMLILYVIQQVNSGKYNLAVGRTIFQKICYALERNGVHMGLEFSRGSYGPFCKQVEGVITVLSNVNLMTEKRAGQMVMTEVSPKFQIQLNKYTNGERESVRKTIDLFSRIKNTEHAEMIATVLFAYDSLRKNHEKVDEKMLLEHILQWKPRWKDQKEVEIIDTIRHLVIWKWMDVEYSPELNLGLDDDLF